jgi:hypothetical protein
MLSAIPVSAAVLVSAFWPKVSFEQFKKALFSHQFKQAMFCLSFIFYTLLIDQRIDWWPVRGRQRR